MSKINRSNYEAFLIDFLEDNCSEELRKEIVLFLEQNPDIAEEFDGMDEFVIPEIDTQFENKGVLKHNELPSLQFINQENYEEYFVRSMDAELNQAERKELLLFLQLNPQLSSEFELFRKTRLQADESIKLHDKSMLHNISIQTLGSIDAQNFETFFVEYHEGELNQEKKNQVLAFIALNPHTQKSFAGLAKTYLTADLSVVFPNKSALKKSATLVPFFSLVRMQRIAVAATIAFVLFFSWMNFINIDDGVDQAAFVKRNSFIHKWPKAMKKVEKTPTRSNTYSSRSMIHEMEPDKQEQTLAMQSTEPILIDRLESRNVASLDQHEAELEIMNIYFAPMRSQSEAPSNFIEVAVQYVKSYQPFVQDFSDQAKNIVANKEIEYQGVDLWGVAEAGLKGFNQLTENSYQINRNMDSPSKP